jgi:hypothetical protein
MATTTNYSWTTPDDTDLVKDGAAAIRTLGSAVDTTTKALNPSTTLGDIEYRSSTANTNTRLGIGSTGQFLSVVGGVPAWASPAASMTLLSTTSMNTGTATVTVSSIDQTYKTLEIHIIDPTWVTGNSQLLLTAQSSSSIQGAGSTMYNSGSNVTAVGYSGTSFAPTAQQTSNTSADLNCVWKIYNYTATTSFKSWGLYYGDASRGGVAGGVIATTTAISSIAITTTQSYNFNGGSILVYGIN